MDIVEWQLHNRYYTALRKANAVLLCLELPLIGNIVYNAGCVKSTVAPWRSGYAAVCKTAYTGSNPVGASTDILSIDIVLGYNQ